MLVHKLYLADTKHCISLQTHHNAVGMLLGSGTWKAVKVEGQMNEAKCTEIREDYLFQSARELQTFIFYQDNDPKHSAKATQKRFVDNTVDVLE